MIETEKPIYDPTKKYRWNPSDNFTISGGEFGVVLNAFRSILNSPDAQRILLAERASQYMEKLMAEAVENGIAIEIKS